MLAGEASKSLGEAFLKDAYISFCSKMVTDADASKSGRNVVVAAGVNNCGDDTFLVDTSGTSGVLGLFCGCPQTLGVTVTTSFFAMERAALVVMPQQAFGEKIGVQSIWHGNSRAAITCVLACMYF
jgi:hypothetical protein